MRCKFRTIVCGDGLYMFPVGGSSLRSSLANGSDFFPCYSFVMKSMLMERFLRSMALSCALNQNYLPDRLLLRFNSRESVD